MSALAYDLLDRPLSFTQMTDFLTCRHRWYLKYVLGIRPKVRSTPMEIGDGVHRALASLLAGGDPLDGLNAWYADLSRAFVIDDDAFNAKAAEMYQTAQAIVERAVTALEDLGYWTLNDPQTGVPLVEHEWNLPLAGWRGGFVVKLDWVAYDPLNKRAWVCDFKTRAYFTTEEDEWSNMQNALYQAGALMNGIDSVGTMTVQINSTPPKQPKQNKDGTMSRAAVACDWQTYEAALRAANLDPSDYADMRASLSGKTYVAVTPVIRSPESIERVWNEIIEPVAAQMVTAYEAFQYDYLNKTAGVPRHLSPRTCNACGVRSLCHSTLKGYGVADLLRTDYNARDDARAVFSE